MKTIFSTSGLLLLAATACLAGEAAPAAAPQPPPAPAAKAAPLHMGRAVETDVFLGIEGRAVTQEEAAACEGALWGNRGLMVTAVVPGSPAEKAGIRVGDIITGKEDMAALLRSMRHMKPGIPLHLTLLRERAKRRPGQTRMKQFHASPRLVSRGKPVHVGRMETKEFKPSPETAAKIEQHQSAIIRLLAVGSPDLETLNAEFDAICALLPPNPMPGHLRLYYKSRGETMSVTRRPDEPMPFTVSLHYPNGQSRLICSLGNSLAEEFRSRFAELEREMDAAKPKPKAGPTEAEKEVEALLDSFRKKSPAKP